MVVMLGLIAGMSRTALVDELAIKLVSITSPVQRGATATVVIQTEPGAACKATFFGEYGSFNLGTKKVDKDGMARWSWPTANEPRAQGTRQVNVSCVAGDKKGQLTADVVVQ